MPFNFLTSKSKIHPPAKARGFFSAYLDKGDNNSNFGVSLIKLYSAPDSMPTNFVSYLLKLKVGRGVKSTTIPLFDHRLGLIGFICINVDISKLDGSKAHAKKSQALIDNFKLTQPNAPIQEVIEIIRKK